MFGLRKEDVEIIKNAIERFDEIEVSIVFGSRAKGNYKKGSDVDIAIAGAKVTRETATRLNDFLNEEIPLPYFFDVLHYETVVNKNLKEHIVTEGIKIFSKEEAPFSS